MELQEEVTAEISSSGIGNALVEDCHNREKYYSPVPLVVVYQYNLFHIQDVALA